MASSKTTGKQTSSRPKTASKTQKRGGATQKKTTGRTTAKRPASLTKAQQEKLLEQKRQHNQVRAVVLFAVAILMGCMVLIPGENVWHWFHDLFMGLFGTWAILWPILLIYVAVMTAMERPVGSLRSKIILSVAIIILACSASYIFSDIQAENPDGYFSILGQLYTTGTTSGGAGISGGLLGYPFVAMMGGIGSKIAILLVLFVTLMILTGTTLVQLFRTMAKPAKVVATNVNQVRERYEVQRQQNRMTNIDIAVDDDELPAHPVQSPIPQPVGAKGEGKKASGKNEKRERLFQVFGMGGKKPEPVAEQEPAQKVEEEIPEIVEKPAVAEEAPLPASAEAAVQAARDAFHTEEKVVAKAEQEKEDLHPAQPQAQPASPAANVSQRPSAFPGSDSPQVSHDGYVFPPTSMLEASRQTNAALELEEQQHNGQLLVQTLKNFGVQTKILDICRGPAVTRYELQPAAGVKISKITNLSDDIAMNLAASGVRIEAPIPGKAAVGIEVPNKHKSVVRMRELIESNSFITAKSRLTVALGRDIAGQVTCADLAKMPHILIAGTTGSGKSVCINSLIISLLYKSTPDEVRFLMIDPKVVELGIYNGIPHLLVPVVTDPRKAAGALGWAVTEMLNRYKTFADCNVRDLSGYNKLAESKNYQDDDGQPMLRMPQIVIIIDELADLMMAAPNEVEDSICRLAQMARAAGMHLVVATQRPSVDVVTGLIKANIPSRIAFTVSSPVDSRTILDASGAEKLLGQGDMLFAPVGCQKPVRIQGCFVSDSEIESIVNFVKHTREETEYDSKIMEEIEKNAVQEREKSSGNEEDPLQDPMINEAIKCVVEAGQASTSLLQRRLRLGYARAGRLIDELEQLGVVGPHEGSKPRQVLMSYQQWLERSAQQPD